MGTILDNAYEAQLEGVFGDLAGAWRWAEEEVKTKG
jgi:hypothetical protein